MNDHVRSSHPPISPPSGTTDGRLDSIDALRGFALAGVLMINLLKLTLFDYLGPAAEAALPSAGPDRWLRMLLDMLVGGKAIGIFTMLFGLGFAMQVERTRRAGAQASNAFLRRIAILACIGLAHRYLLWWNEILTIYALMAFVLYQFRNAGNGMLIWVGLLVALAAPGPSPDALLDEESMKAANLVAFSSPSFLTALGQNIEFSNWAWLAYWGVFPLVFGRFLIGYWAGRKGLFSDAAGNRQLLQRICLLASCIGIVGTVLQQKFGSVPAFLPSGSAFLLWRALVRAGDLGLSIAYATGFALLFLRPCWRRWLQWLAPVGRMALSNYLGQTVVGMVIFYGFGFGVGPWHGYPGLLLAWAAVFGAQVLLSHWWLRRFRFGPCEWAWRSLTYGAAQPMRRRSSTPQGEPAGVGVNADA